MKQYARWMVCGLVVVATIACGDDGEGQAEADAGPVGSEQDGAASGVDGGLADGGGAAVGSPCASHSDCASSYCESYQDAPPDPEQSCQPAPEVGTMRITGTVRDLVSGDAVADARVRVAGALGAASNPAVATALAMAETNDAGRFTAETSEANGEPLGLVGLVESDAHFLSATGLAAPFDGTTDYAAGNGTHDVWVVAQEALSTWSELPTRRLRRYTTPATSGRDHPASWSCTIHPSSKA